MSAEGTVATDGNADGTQGVRHRRAPVTQPHGGALVPGAGGGPQPGAGRKPSDLRARLREAAGDRIDVIEQIADSPTATDRDRLRAIELTLRYGMSENVSRDDVRTALAETMKTLRQLLPADHAELVIRAIARHWTSP